MALGEGRRLHRAACGDPRPERRLPHRDRSGVLMQVTRIDSARPYDAPKHHDMRALRLQGFDASDAAGFWVGLSHFLPGGGAQRDATPLEKVYVIVDGEVVVATDAGETT